MLWLALRKKLLVSRWEGSTPRCCLLGPQQMQVFTVLSAYPARWAWLAQYEADKVFV